MASWSSWNIKYFKKYGRTENISYSKTTGLQLISRYISHRPIQGIGKNVFWSQRSDRYIWLTDVMLIVSSQFNTFLLRTVPCRCSGQSKWYIIQLKSIFQKTNFTKLETLSSNMSTLIYPINVLICVLIFQQPLYGFKIPKMKEEKGKLR